MKEYIPENNLVVLLFLLVLTVGFYYFWWLARISRVFNDDPVINIILTIFTGGLWSVYLLMKYMQMSEAINGRDMKWFMVFFFFLSPFIIQHNINEKYFPER